MFIAGVEDTMIQTGDRAALVVSPGGRLILLLISC
jgi:hypothetical protein